MNDRRGPDGLPLPDAERLTPLGRLVRSTSLDELPQLINVLKGDMSLIGPRPLTMDYSHVFSDEHRRRHEVRPGITGLAQVHGRGFCKLSRKFAYDVQYVDECSLKMDLGIVMRTIRLVLVREDVGTGDAMMEEIDDLGFEERMREYYRTHEYDV